MVFFHAEEEIKMPTIDMTATGLRISALRDAAGLTNKDLAEAMGFSTRNAVYKWLGGDALPSLDNLVILADLLGVTMDDILVVRKL